MEPLEYRQAVAAYLADCRRRGLRPATLKHYEFALGRVGDSLGVALVQDIAIGRVRGFIDDAGMSPVSVRGILRALRTFTGWLVDEGLLERDPLARLRMPHVDERLVVVPTDDELVRLLRAAAPTLRVALAVLAGTGIRANDLAGIGDGSLRPGGLVLLSTKNRAGRLVPLDPVLEALLRRHAADRRPSEDGALLVTRSGRRLGGDALRLAMTDARARAGIAIRVSPHVLRHWHARDLGAHGISDRLMAARMGWRSPSLVGRYAPVSEHELRLDVERYAPLVRLRDDGWLDGVFPRSVLIGLAAHPAKNERSRVGESARTSPRARRS